MDIKSAFFGAGGNVTKFTALTGISELVTLIVRGSFALAGLILLFYFIVGGIGMISSAGKGDAKAAEQAKQTITSAVIGFVVVFTAYWIVKLLGQLLLKNPNII
ncbi:MAG TPA: hypothetical protein VKC53_00515 [Patescibacteria group bacterium]|nr:hypothetical protein [Patescibacteria group bacterium]